MTQGQPVKHYHVKPLVNFRQRWVIMIRVFVYISETIQTR